MSEPPNARAERPAAPVAVVIPAFNEARTIRGLVERALQQVPLVIVVDDASGDGTAAALGGLPVTLLRHPENRGKGAALASGFQAALAAGARAVVTLDGDGQHRPEDIPRFLARARQRPDFVLIGSRAANREDFPRSRYIANRVADFWISWAAGQHIDDSQSGFRLYPRAVLASVTADDRKKFVFESELLIDAARRGVRTEALPIPALYHGTNLRPSHFRPVADISAIVVMVAWKLLSRGLYPWGLYTALRERWSSRQAAAVAVAGALSQDHGSLPLEQKSASPAE